MATSKEPPGGNGSGLRLLECLRLRVKDLDFGRRELTVREGKGDKDRVTLLPESLEPDLLDHLEKVRRIHEKDLAAGFGAVYLPHALNPKTRRGQRRGSGSTSSRRVNCRSIREPGPNADTTRMRGR